METHTVVAKPRAGLDARAPTHQRDRQSGNFTKSRLLVRWGYPRRRLFAGRTPASLEAMDDLDNLSVQAIYAERVRRNDHLSGRTLEDAARELGFDPDELFEESSAEDDATPH